MSGSFTEDRLLGGRVTIVQPEQSDRVAIDAILLAAAVPAQRGDRVIEAGAGTGCAAICLAVRTSCRVIGLELRPALTELANENAARNQLSERVMFLVGDILWPPPAIGGATFDHAMANPPFYPAGAVRHSPNPERARARVEGEAALASWVTFLATAIAPSGTVTMIHTAERGDEVVDAFARHLGAIRVLPIAPTEGAPARRVIVQGVKGAADPPRMLPPFILHRGRAYSEAAEAILRGGGALDLR